MRVNFEFIELLTQLKILKVRILFPHDLQYFSHIVHSAPALYYSGVTVLDLYWKCYIHLYSYKNKHNITSFRNCNKLVQWDLSSHRMPAELYGPKNIKI